jgi:cytidylate kinase
LSRAFYNRAGAITPWLQGHRVRRVNMPIITISGSMGSGALDVGRRVADKLGFDYVDREILVEAARTLGVSVDAVEDRDEKTPTPSFGERLASLLRNFLERSATAGASDPLMGTSGLEVLLSTSYGEAAALPAKGSEPSDARYKEAITSIINDVADKGNVVIIGRGSQTILRERPGCLHVRTTAPLDLRVQRIAEREAISEEEAKQRVHESDKGQIDYHRKYFKVEPTDPDLYDLTINTEHLPSEEAAELIAAAARSLPAGRHGLLSSSD